MKLSTTARSALALAIFCWLTPAARAADDGTLLGGGFMDIIDKGGTVMIIILGLSVVGLAFAFERLVALRKGVLVPKSFVGLLKEATGKHDMPEVERLVSGQKGPLARILAAGLKRHPHGPGEMERAMEAVGEQEVDRLKRPVRPLSVLANIEPLLGLLGTILGMITTFNLLHTTSAAERVETLAPGIGQALYTTAAGLTVAIPFVLLYHYLIGRVNRAAEEWSVVGSDLTLAVRNGVSKA